MSVPGSNQIQFPSISTSTFSVDVVTDPNNAPADVLDLDLGFTVKGHIDFPNWLSGTEAFATSHGAHTAVVEAQKLLARINGDD